MTADDYDMEVLIELVKRKRRSEGWSVRAAAKRGPISNTTWGDFENGRIALTDTVRAGVSVAFEWPMSWPENPPSLPPADVDRLERRVLRLEEAVRLILQGNLDAALALLESLPELPEDW